MLLFHKVMLIAWLLLLLMSLARSYIINIDNLNRIIYEKLGKILRSCSKDHQSTLVIMSGSSDDTHMLIWDGNWDGPVIIADHNFEKLWPHSNFPQWPTFVLTVDSENTLETMIQRLKSSAYWNIDSMFFIVGDQAQSCDNALSILKTTWKMDILSSFYLCDQSLDGSVHLYTYNPFTDRAPHSWTKVEISRDSSDDENGMLFYHPYSEDQEFCQHLDFDKTKFLDGYRVKAVANTKSGEPWEANRNYDITSLREKLSLSDGMVFTTIFEKMNVTPMIHFDIPGFFVNETAVGFLPKLLNGSYDIEMSGRMLTPKVKLTYPFVTLEIAILTRHRNFLEPIEKIANFYSIGAVSLTVVTLVTTWFIFVMRNRGQMIPAALEVLRMLLSTGLLQRLQRTSIRIYLFGVFWLIIILNATFQGNLAAFLTKPERHDVETVKDLEDYRYHVYIPHYLFVKMSNEDWVLRLIEKHRIHSVREIDCYSYVLNDSSAACIQIVTRQFKPAMSHNLHLSQPIKTVYGVYWHRDNWSLAKKFHFYYSQLMQSGLLSHWNKKMIEIPMQKLRANEEKETAPVIRPLKLSDLTFAFLILAIGLTISTIFFILELRGR